MAQLPALAVELSTLEVPDDLLHREYHLLELAEVRLRWQSPVLGIALVVAQVGERVAAVSSHRRRLAVPRLVVQHAEGDARLRARVHLAAKKQLLRLERSQHIVSAQPLRDRELTQQHVHSTRIAALRILQH